MTYIHQDTDTNSRTFAIACTVGAIAAPLLVAALAPASALWAPLALVTPFISMGLLEHKLESKSTATV